MAELHHECGIAAVYHLPQPGVSLISPPGGPDAASQLIPRLLLEIQNRGQLAAGITSYKPDRNQILVTHKDVGMVREVFQMSKQEENKKLLESVSGHAAIGHVRYATCGKDDRNFAQPFERPHLEKHKWFAFGFNGQLANYNELRSEIVAERNYHLARDTDTEIIMHLISRELSGDRRPSMVEMLHRLSKKLDGAYNIVLLNARGDMCVARDPLGIRPVCFAQQGPMFVAASESVALDNLGIERSTIQTLEPGHAVIISDGQLSVQKFAESPRHAHCFFEWIYFANVASTLDDRSVYLARKNLGEELGAQEDPLTDEQKANTIVVPVPDTAKAAADAMAFRLGIPSLEGLIRNRVIGRTFIEGDDQRADKVRMKYTPLHDVMAGKRVLLVDDTIVRSSTMQNLIDLIRRRGGAAEVHVRVACPPIIAPCFYGIDMSTIPQLFAPKFIDGGFVNREVEMQMAKALKADSLRYLPIEAISRCIGKPSSDLCQACIDRNYPTDHGHLMYQEALLKISEGNCNGNRIFDNHTQGVR